jgi:hypothetical protein
MLFFASATFSPKKETYVASDEVVQHVVGWSGCLCLNCRISACVCDTVVKGTKDTGEGVKWQRGGSD